MRLGDLVRHQDKVWLVRRYDDSQLRLATLQDAAGQTIEVPHDLDQTPECVVLANPFSEWPYLIVRENSRGRFMSGLSRVVRGVRVPFVMLTEWLPNDPARPGGPVYLNPEAGVRPADTLLVSWSNGPDTSVHVPVAFGTMAQKVARIARKKAPTPTNYDRLLQDRFGEDD